MSEKLPLVLEQMTVLEVRETLQTEKTALLPVGCVEQHGYHLPLGTDSMTAEYICLQVARRRPVFLLPAQKYTYSGGTLEGTVQIEPDTVYRVIRDILSSLYAQGFRGVVCISGHGGLGHTTAVNRAVTELTSAHRDYHIAFACVGRELSPKCADVLQSERTGSSHATEVETSMIMHIAPNLVRIDKLDCWEDRPSLRDPLDPIDAFIKSRAMENERIFSARQRIGVGAPPRPARDGYGGVILEDCTATVTRIVDRVRKLVRGDAP